MRAATFLLGIVVTAAIVYCVYYYRVELGMVRPATPAPAMAAEPSGSPEYPTGTVTWQTIDRPADGFRVDLPAGATEAQVPSYTARGAVEQVEMLQASTSPLSTFAVSWAQNPPVERTGGQDPDRILDLALNGALVRTQTALISQSRSTFAGYQSRDFSARGDGGVMTARLILAGNRLFLLIASFPSQSAQHDADVNRFFNSFAVTAPSRAN